MSQPNEKLEALFEAAVALDTDAQRAAYLDRACPDPELRREVESLLAAHQNPDSVLAERTIGLEPEGSEGVGMVIGRYKLLEALGEGGCGVVWLAEQKEPVRRKVALKVIKLGMDTKQVVARFEAERQALALMDHPNIAKVLDAGTTETGRPYFVMELVRGIPVTKFCDQNKLATRERLDLFIKVCHAVQHAHQKGIIHRDLKPSNVLVTLHDGVPVPKVIDFGIAKATQQELTDKTIHTLFQQFIGTPAYVSPEQAEMSGLDVDTRSDIYSLGVLLYELLTGKTPFDAKQLLASGLDEMRRTIREKEPVRPSTRLSTMLEGELTTTAKHRGIDAPKLVHLLRGDVDWIVMKCLEKDRTRRYETANGLASDIQRHLNNEAVLARPASAAYRFEKLVRRNKLAFAAVASVATVLVLGVTVSTWQAIRATQAKHEANKQRQSADKSAQEARQAEQNAEAQRNVAVKQRKLADMQLALQAWEEGDLQRADDLIEASRPAPGEAPAFEWRYLRKLCQDQSIETFGSSNHPYRSAQFFDRDVLLLNDEKTLILHNVSRGEEQLLLEDPDGIWSPAFCSGNTNLLATVTDDNRIKVWDVAARRVQVEFEGHPRLINAIAFSRDGRWLASTSSDKSVKLWDVESKNCEPVRTLHLSYQGNCVAFSPDGKQLFSSGSESVIRAWDVATGTEAAAPLEGHTTGIPTLAASPDGLWMASGSGDGTVIVWNVVSRKPERRLVSYSAPVFSVAFSPDGRTLASGGRDCAIRLWDFKTGQQRSPLRGHKGSVNWLSFSPDGRRLVSQSQDGLVKLWQPTTGPEGNVLAGIPKAMVDVALSVNGRHLASVAIDSFAANLWDLPARRVTLLAGHSNAVICVAFSPDGRILATGSHDQTVRLWDVSDQKAVATLTNEFPVGSLAFSPDGRTLIVGGSMWHAREGDRDRGGLQFWDLPSQQATGTIPGTASNIVGIALSANGSLLATGEKSGSVSLWDAQTRQLLRRFESQSGRQVNRLAFSPTEPLLAACDPNGIIGLYNTTTLDALNPPLKAHTWRVMALAFSPDGRTLASAGEGGGLMLWDVASRQVALRLKGHVGTGCGVAFSRDGNLLASCGFDATVRLWPAATLEEAGAATRTTQENP